MPTTELEYLIDAVGGRAYAEDLCRVHRTTMGRWLSGKIKPPAAALATLRAAAWGQMPGRDRTWDGWFFRDGLLWSPEGERFDAGEIRALVYMRKVITAQREQIVTLERQIVAATREASRHDPAANDNAIWPADVRSKAYE